MLYLAADHAGFELKEKIKKYLSKRQIPFKDVGAFKYDKNDDYPDFAYKAAVKIAESLGCKAYAQTAYVAFKD